jgi:hypothetical protein
VIDHRELKKAMGVGTFGMKAIPDPQQVTAQRRPASRRLHSDEKCRDAMKRTVPSSSTRSSVKTRHTIAALK